MGGWMDDRSSVSDGPGGTPAVTFQCRQCGQCCRWPGYVYLTASDIQRLSNHWKITEEAFLEAWTCLAPNRGQLCLKSRSDGACCLLTEENRCVCYEARPAQCRQYPSLWAPPEGCPGFIPFAETE